MAIKKSAYQYVNFTFLDNLVMGDTEFKKKVIQMFIDKTPAVIKSMHELYAKEDWEGLKAIAHKFKSSIDFVGANLLAEIVTDLEQNSENAEGKAVIKKEIDEIEELCTSIYKELDVELKKI